MKTRIERVGWGEKDRQHISINAIAQRRDETKKEGEKIKFWNETYSLAGARSSSDVIVKVKPAKGTEPFSSFFFFCYMPFGFSKCTAVSSCVSSQNSSCYSSSCGFVLFCFFVVLFSFFLSSSVISIVWSRTKGTQERKTHTHTERERDSRHCLCVGHKSLERAVS